MALLPFASVGSPVRSVIDKGGQVFNVKAYGAKGDGVTDDLAAFNLAIAAAMAVGGGVVFVPPGVYGISDTIKVYLPGDTSVPAHRQGVSIVSGLVPGRIGDSSTDTNSVEFIPLNGYPTGHLMLDYYSLTDANAILGGHIQGLGFRCNSIAGGVRISNPRRFRAADINIDHPAIPVVSAGSGAYGGFNVNQQSGTATAYSVFDNISVAFSLQDGFSHTTTGNDIFSNCFDLNAARYAYNCAGSARYIACHYEKSQYGWNINGGTNIISVIACDTFGAPTKNAVILASGGAQHNVNFIGCTLTNSPTASPGEQNGSIILVANSGSHLIQAQFIGCSIEADTNTTDFVYVQNAVAAGSSVDFSNCNFIGTPTTNKFNNLSASAILHISGCAGLNPAGNITAPSVPASTTAYTNVFPYDCTVFVNGGTVSAIAIGGVATGQTSGAFRVPNGQTITLTYTVAPTWTWYGD